MSARGWKVTTEGDGVARVRPGTQEGGGSTSLGQLLEANEHRVLLATDLHEWPTHETVLPGYRLPVVAALRAPLAGDQLLPALAADIRIAADSLVLEFQTVDGEPVVSHVIIALLARLVGTGTAAYWLLTRRSVTAAEALEAGLVHQVVPTADVDEAALEVARSVAAGAPLALEYAKEALRRGSRAGLLDAIEIEGDLYSILHTTDDRSEGVRSFLEHRDPLFRGR